MGAALAPIFAAMFAGGMSILMSRFSIDALANALLTLSPTIVGFVPTQLLMLLNRPGFDPQTLRACRFVICGGGVLDPQLRKEVRALLPENFVEVYASSETDLISLSPRREPDEKWGSVGIPRMPVHVSILDENDRRLPAGAIGEIVVNSRANMTDYVTRQDPPTTWYHDAQGQRYFRTGDLGRFDDDGFLWVVGRKKEMIKTAGFNIFPADIETVLLTHPDIGDAAVVGVPHAVLGEIPFAFIVPRAPRVSGGGQAENDILRWVNARLNKSQLLQGVRFIEALPRNAGGKVVSEELRRAAKAGRFA
jgi:acyl-CoA synthetase (AMP-forming)/AMP-acid ligase II